MLISNRSFQVPTVELELRSHMYGFEFIVNDKDTQCLLILISFDYV